MLNQRRTTRNRPNPASSRIFGLAAGRYVTLSLHICIVPHLSNNLKATVNQMMQTTCSHSAAGTFATSIPSFHVVTGFLQSTAVRTTCRMLARVLTEVTIKRQVTLLACCRTDRNNH